MSVAGYYQITRPVNAGVAGLTAAAAYWMCGGTDIITAVLLFFAVTFICGAGNSLNDCLDADIDRINRPKRPIPAGKVTIFGGGVLTVILFAAGFLCSLPVLPWCPILAAVNILLLILYSTSFKRMPIFGNLCVAYLTGSIFLFGGMAVGKESFLITTPLFLITFFVTLAWEMIKDAEDIAEDKEAGIYTLPMLTGVPAVSKAVCISIVCAVLSSYLLIIHWGFVYAVLITAVNAFLLFASAKAILCRTPEEIRASKASSSMKYGLFAVILVFLLAAVFARIL